MQITAEGRFYRERRRSELLDDRCAGNRTRELARVNGVGRQTCAQVRTLGGIDGNHKHRAGRQLRAANSIEAEHGGDIYAVGRREAGRRVPALDDDHQARHGWQLERSSHRERHAQAWIRPDDVPPAEVELPGDAFQSVSLYDGVHDWSPAYQRRCRNGNRFDDDAVTAQRDVADRTLVSGGRGDRSRVEARREASVDHGIAGYGYRNREHDGVGHVAIDAQRLPPGFLLTCPRR